MTAPEFLALRSAPLPNVIRQHVTPKCAQTAIEIITRASKIQKQACIGPWNQGPRSPNHLSLPLLHHANYPPPIEIP